MSMYEQTMHDKAEELGYAVTLHEGRIVHVFPKSREGYSPEIYRREWPVSDDAGWLIQTTAYGAKRPEEIAQVIDGYNRAMRMVGLLETFEA